MTDEHTWREMSSDSNEAWQVQAGPWDDRMGDDGNDFHLLLVRPVTEKLLQLRPGERVLDIACGNGIFSRRLARLGAQVTAVDVSATLIDRARARGGADDAVDYRVLDAASEGQLMELEHGSYDDAVCNMALMDMAEIDPLAKSLARLLIPNGRLVFSVTHPCFNSAGTSRVVEEYRDEEGIQQRRAIKVTSYITPQSGQAVGIDGRSLQYSFHRPIGVLLRCFFSAGFVLDELEEPVFEPQEERELGQGRFPEIPWALVARMRPQLLAV